MVKEANTGFVTLILISMPILNSCCCKFFLQLPTESLFYRAVLQVIIEEIYGVTKR